MNTEIQVINNIIKEIHVNNDSYNNSELLSAIISWIKLKKLPITYTVKKIHTEYGYSIYQIVRKDED